MGGYLELDDVSKEECYNSMYVLDRTGQLICNYRKMFLFDSEQVYFHPGKDRPVINMVNLDNVPIKVGFGICMDIEYDTNKEESEFKFAEFYGGQEVDLVLFLTAWCWFPENLEEMGDKDPHKFCFDWWRRSLTPMISSRYQNPRYTGPRYEKEWAFAASSCIGGYNDFVFVDCSSVIIFNRPS